MNGLERVSPCQLVNSSLKREVKNKIQDYSPFRPVQNSSDNSWLTGSGEDTVNAYLQRHLCQLRSADNYYLSHFSLRSISRESIENVVFIDCLNHARGYFKCVLLEREGISQEQLNHFWMTAKAISASGEVKPELKFNV